MPGTLAGGIVATAAFIITAAGGLFAMYKLTKNEEETE